MVVKKFFSMLLITLCVFLALGSARIVIIHPDTIFITSEETTSFDTLDFPHYARAITGSSTVASVASTVSTDPISNATLLSASPTTSQASSVTATPSLRELDNGAACTSSYTLPGLLAHPCFFRATSLHTSRHAGSAGTMLIWAKNITTTTETSVQSVTSTRTITLTISEVTPFPTTITITTDNAPSKTMATGFCFWEEQAVLTPCTSMVFASAKPSSAAIPGARNLFRELGEGVRWARNVWGSFTVRG